MKSIEEKLSLIYIDANVWLGDHVKGLGCYLYEALDSAIPVIGVSKTSFHNSEKQVVPVLRAQSKNPLYVSSIGVETEEAAKMIFEMSGGFRLPAMIKLADSISRN
jgi:deoxyribonuclease V